jgi:glycosidase
LLNLYRALLRLRSGSTAIKHGGLTLIEVEPGVLAYRREFEEERLNIYINLNRYMVNEQVDGADRLALRVDEVTLNHGELFLPPQSGAVVRL